LEEGAAGTMAIFSLNRDPPENFGKKSLRNLSGREK
jgi:hypothetical protein